ncbi:hypothetical protein HA466_0036790 [Hirschfeldia incana]|nr:hypothetical protein HA466_0036790 [Hirschfeldia incana]
MQLDPIDVQIVSPPPLPEQPYPSTVLLSSILLVNHPTSTLYSEIQFDCFWRESLICCCLESNLDHSHEPTPDSELVKHLKSVIKFRGRLISPSAIQGLEFSGLDLPDSIGEFVVSGVIVLQCERVLQLISRFMQARKQKGSDHSVKAHGDGWLLTVALVEGVDLGRSKRAL